MNEIEGAIAYFKRCIIVTSKDLDSNITKEITIQALEEKLERENPQPLAMEEIRKMDGQPVWVVFVPESDGEQFRMWCLVEVDPYGSIYLTNCYGAREEFAKWSDVEKCGIKNIYSYKPKEDKL